MIWGRCVWYVIRRALQIQGHILFCGSHPLASALPSAEVRMSASFLCSVKLEAALSGSKYMFMAKQPLEGGRFLSFIIIIFNFESFYFNLLIVKFDHPMIFCYIKMRLFETIICKIHLKERGEEQAYLCIVHTSALRERSEGERKREWERERDPIPLVSLTAHAQWLGLGWDEAQTKPRRLEPQPHLLHGNRCPVTWDIIIVSHSLS